MTKHWREYLDQIVYSHDLLEAERAMQKRYPGAYILVQKSTGLKFYYEPKFRDKGREIIWLLKNS